jgi:8-oxo-dGTP pyrophosphatase MutT (NUDIX family)
MREASYDNATRDRQLVAAVCFRILSTDIEFLLVRTRRGRWTFPKGGVEAGLTDAQSAAIEAYEEAGVHGRIEEISFTRYKLLRTRFTVGEGSHDLVHAHLCEVLRHSPPMERYRDPTWFSSEKAKGRLAQGRSAENGTELARVVDRAIARIRRQPGRTLIAHDPLLKVQFEAFETDNRDLNERVPSLAPLARARRHYTSDRRSPASGKILQLPATEAKKT